MKPGNQAIRPSEWDEEYRAGRWRYLHEAAESPRYSTLARLLQRLSPGERILDAGCGEGILRLYLPADRRWRYTGLDHSAEALARLLGNHPDSRTILGALTYLSNPAPQRFDALVFNEVLYYLDDPAAPVAAGEYWLAPGGVMLISMYRPPSEHPWAERVASSWRAIEALGFRELARQEESVAGTQRCWDIRAYGTV